VTASNGEMQKAAVNAIYMVPTYTDHHAYKNGSTYVHKSPKQVKTSPRKAKRDGSVQGHSSPRPR
jgi:hypothetical protein